MSKLFYSTLLFCATLVFFSCKDDPIPEPEVIDFQYAVTIHKPNADDRHVNDSMHLHIDFVSQAALPIHHVNIRIYNKVTNEDVVYNKPEVAHVHEMSGMYSYHDDFVLSNANGVVAHTDWIVEAKVWGHEAGLGEVIETVEFHVHPE